MDAPVTSFPFNLMGAPMYYGSTMSFMGTALLYGRPAGLVLSAEVLVIYSIALSYEESVCPPQKGEYWWEKSEKLTNFLGGNHIVHSRAKFMPKGIGNGKKGRWNKIDFSGGDGKIVERKNILRMGSVVVRALEKAKNLLLNKFTHIVFEFGHIISTAAPKQNCYQKKKKKKRTRPMTCGDLAKAAAPGTTQTPYVLIPRKISYLDFSHQFPMYLSIYGQRALSARYRTRRLVVGVWHKSRSGDRGGVVE